jgi:NAD(P)-dependent dehydrogenase (short-subunit alcohol dehydrogenase family)
MACSYHEAVLATDGSGDVTKGAGIGRQIAVDRRKAGNDVVVCGADPKENRREAREIEIAASDTGNYILHGAHSSPGANALNHYQAIAPPPHGHCFYETKGRKAK